MGETEIAGWREKNGQFLNSMRYAERIRMTEAVEHQTSRVTDTDDGHGHVLQKKGGRIYGMAEIFGEFSRKDSFGIDFFEFRDQQD